MYQDVEGPLTEHAQAIADTLSAGAARHAEHAALQRCAYHATKGHEYSAQLAAWTAVAANRRARELAFIEPIEAITR